MAGTSRPQEPAARVNHAGPKVTASLRAGVYRSAQSCLGMVTQVSFWKITFTALSACSARETCPGRCVNGIAGELPAFRKS